MADIRIKDLTTTASSTASDDFIAVDGTTNGTRKLSAFSPTFGGNATVTGTLTSGGLGVGGAANIGGTLTIANTSAELVLGVNSGSALSYIIRPAQAGGAIEIVQNSASVNRWISLGGVSNSLGYTESLRITNGGHVAVINATASTSTSTGALVVSGGVGVAGKVTSTALGLANTSQSAAAWGDVGVQLSVAGAVLTDTSSSGTVGRIVTNSIAASALAASSTTTYTAAASLFIAGAPTANTNVTITNAYALYTAGGRINFQGLPTSSAGLQAGTLWNDGGTLKVA